MVALLVTMTVGVGLGAVNCLVDGVLMEVDGLDVMLVIVGVVQFVVSVMIGVVLGVVMVVVVGVVVSRLVVGVRPRMLWLVVAINVMLFEAVVVGMMTILVRSLFSDNLVV